MANDTAAAKTLWMRNGIYVFEVEPIKTGDYYVLSMLYCPECGKHEYCRRVRVRVHNYETGGRSWERHRCEKCEHEIPEKP